MSGCNFVMSDGRVCRDEPINPDCPARDLRCLDHKDRVSYTLCETAYCDWWTNRSSGFCRYCDDLHRKQMAGVLRRKLREEEVVADLCLHYLQDRRALRSRRLHRSLVAEFGDALYLES
jgi:hypothetical protein